MQEKQEIDKNNTAAKTKEKSNPNPKNPNPKVMPPLTSVIEPKKRVVTIINSKEALVLYFPKLLTRSQASKYYLILLKKAEWEQDDLIVRGKAVKPPRKISSYGDEGIFYRYSGAKKVARKWLQELQELRDMVTQAIYDYIKDREYFNFALLNYYENGKNYIGKHADSETDMVKNSVIASVSLGAERDFVLHHNFRDEKKVVKLGHGSLLLMGGQCQTYYKHSVPKRLRVKEGRINITFRKMRVYTAPTENFKKDVHSPQ